MTPEEWQQEREDAFRRGRGMGVGFLVAGGLGLFVIAIGVVAFVVSQVGTTP